MHDLDTFVDQQRESGLSAATIKRRVAVLKTYFDFLSEDSGELHRLNPVRFTRHAGKQLASHTANGRRLSAPWVNSVGFGIGNWRAGP